MGRSKSRLGSFGSGRRSHQSVFSKTISASKLCRRDTLLAQIDTNALQSVDRINPPTQTDHSSEREFVRITTMQQHAGRLEEELKTTRERLRVVERERDKAWDELRETKMVAHEASMKLSEEALSSQKVGEMRAAELNAMKQSLANSERELRTKVKDMESLRIDLDKANQFQILLAERNQSFDRLKEELNAAKTSEARAVSLASENEKRAKQLEDQLERGKLSEAKMLESVVSQTKLLEQTKIELEEFKLEIASLHEKMERVSDASPKKNSRVPDGASNYKNLGSINKSFESLQSELQLAKENLFQAQEAEKVALVKVKGLTEEMNSLRSELKFALEAEEKSKKAMDDLALALKEVATESNQAKEKLSLTESELGHARIEAEQLKEMVRNNEDRYKKLLDEARKENELQKNTIERLRLEAEESLLAWNDKEMGFVGCIKSAEDERTLAQQENVRLVESLKAAENTARTLREENHKLRDILKQGLNEANVAKEAAGIAKEENSLLKDCLAEKDEALDIITRENERLRISEAAAHENIKELTRLLSASSKKPKTNAKENGMTSTKSFNLGPEEPEGGKKRLKTFSFDVSELKRVPNQFEDLNEKVAEEDPIRAEALKGSIFDTQDSPKSEPQTPLHRRMSPPIFADDGETVHSEDFEHLECSHSPDDADSDRHSPRKRRALLQRFTDLLRRKGSHVHRKELSAE